MSEIDFEILIDDSLMSVFFDSSYDKKHLLSIVNGFEDGKWRYEVFHDFIWDNIVETALSAKERDSLSSKHSSALKKAARNLRLSDDKLGGEIGEIFLYGVLKRHFGALPIVPKIFYKQNTQDYAKGADSIHVVIDNNGDFTLWIGEAKFYDDLSPSRLDKIVESVKQTLSTSKLRKEFNIVTSLQDIDKACPDTSIAQKIKTKLADGVSIDEIKEILHVPIMILHECNITSSQSIMNNAYKQDVRNLHAGTAKSYIDKQNTKLSSLFCYDKIVFHVILFPVPSKSSIVDAFTESATSKRQ